MPHTIRLHRVLRAPPERVYRAFLEPAAMVKWLPPFGFTGTVHEIDARVGGGHRMSFTNFGTGESHSFGGRYLELLVRGAGAFAHLPEVTTPLLKLVAEMVLQRGQRINFGNYSPNGVLLFRFASQAVVAYGTRMADVAPPPGADPYAAKYKTVAVCAAILARALDGGYVNFGVFELYGDPALRDAASMLLRLLLCVPAADLMKYPKVATLYMLTMPRTYMSAFMNARPRVSCSPRLKSEIVIESMG